ncbi:spectrin alpha chain isoform X2 [Coccinella septempunctata]|uniref:spectrin alpha chain isoform X2 n=1 Tax=Coccinella septempunctata TaxID=41139 RepID=UPI001D063C56|nr:spectrin alpha chain isoform X2 [Coccinella septempunctata]
MRRSVDEGSYSFDHVGRVQYGFRFQNRSPERTNMTQRDEVQKFEQGRIKFLQEERLHIQKKTFTKWMNCFLQKARMEVNDLFVDLGDGKKLLKLLEIISGEKLGKPNNGRMRVHKIENVNKSLAFLHTKVRLESIGAEDIVDGNPRLILGLVWTIILRFQIQEIEIDVDEDNESSEKKSAKDALLLWAQRKTHGYPGVNINDFSSSWRSGLGFNALIHNHRPDLFDYNSLVQNKNIDNLNHAFDVANNELGIPRLLDAEDIDTSRPDEKSIMTYVASYYHTFARMKNEEKSGRRIAKIINQMVDSDKNKVRYEKMTTDLLEWIHDKITQLENRDFPNSLEGIQVLLLAFGRYRTQEKPPKYKERSEIEALYFNINTQLKELRQPSYTPPDGKLVQDIERAWETLETSEHNREVALRTELRRQERLEQLCFKFERKVILREGYLKEMIQVLSEPRYGSNLGQVDATNKKHEAIIADIMSRESRIHDLTQMCDELIRENYRDSEKVKAKHQKINEQWDTLMALLDKHKKNLNRMGQIMSLLREIDTTMVGMQQLKSDLSTVDTGVHLIAVEELLQRHALQELQLTSFGDSVKKLQRLGDQVQVDNAKEKELVNNKLDSLQAAYKELQEVSAHRKAILDEARNFYQFLQDQGDAEAWLIEKERICQAGITAKDLRGVLALQQKHKVLIDEIKARKTKIDQLGSTGKQLLLQKHPRSPEIQQHMDKMKQEWAKLEELVDKRSKQLQDAVETYQFYADANEADSWLNEKTSLVVSSDYGSDEPSAQALLSRHKDLEGEINAYSGDVQSLNTQAERLIASGISHLDLTSDNQPEEPVEETVYETRMVPMEVYEDEPVERVEYKTVLEERKVPQVRALYPFNDHGLTMVKGEVMFLLNKSNPDWWCVRKADGTDGFAPANYVAEIEPRIIQIPLKKAETVKTIQRVKKTKMVNQKVPVKVYRQRKQPKSKVDDNVSVPKRQKRINDTYDDLKKMAARRHALLEDSMRLFKFYKECDDFERWMKDKEKFLGEEPDGNVEQAKRKYEKFVTDLSASSNRMDELEEAVKEFESMNHSQIDKVKARYRQIQSSWKRLNLLKTQKERSLAGASSVELFQKLCEEAKDWMMEKMEQLKIDILGHDLKTVQALQRKHDNLERELNPLEDKVSKVILLANSVKTSYPSEKGNVMEKQKEIEELWQKVKDKALERRARLEDAVGLQIFDNSCKDLLNWVIDVKNEINAENTVRDVQTAENLLKHHKDLEKEILSKNDEFKQLANLGRKLCKSHENKQDIEGKVQRLEEEQAALMRGWKEKLHWIEQCLQLQNFNKEADNIDAATSAHFNFLEYPDHGSSLDEVEALQKQHRAFTNTLFAQDDRINAFNKRADLLIADQHYESSAIDEKRNHVLDRRSAVKELSQQKWKKLEACKNYQEFCAEVDDLRAWMADKSKTASDESYRDLANLERKLQKHEAFERELRANEGQLRTVNNLGQALISENSIWKDEVARTLSELNSEWQDLVGLSLKKGRCLRQAVNQHAYNSAVDDVKTKLDEIEDHLNSQNLGNDLRSCKDLLRRHEDLVTELGQCANRVDDLVKQSGEMNEDGHFDSATIGNKAVALQKRLYDLDKPAKQRRAKLEKSLQYYKFWFDLDTQLQWIKDHLPLASSDALGQNLHQAQNLYKKHKKLEAEIQGHQPDIDKTLGIGKELIEQEHPEKIQIEKLSNDLIFAWNDLNQKAALRAQNLEQSLKAQQFFFEASEVEAWLNEKSDVLASTDYGRDRDSATKLLTKHKVLQLELDTYKNIIAEMGRGVQELTKTNHPESKTIIERQSSLEHLVRSLQRKAALRQHRLMESLFRHEYFSESEELEDWILDNLQQASSEDYGQDYEHLIILRNKFDDFKLRIESGAERFKQCEALAQKLIANQSSYINEINTKQEQLDTETPSEIYDEVMERHELVSKAWEKLHEQINNREVRLQAAGEIHRFHRDVADALQRIQEKNASLGTELGRDLNSALALLRKHEKFENELVALEAQLQILVEDASRLQKVYPSNKPNIQQKQELVVDAWNKLKQRDDARHDQLQASVDLQRFFKQVRDLTNWAIGLRLAMSAEEKARSIARAQVLKSEHDALKSEIEARERSFHEVAENLTAMEQTGHYAAAEAVEKYKNLVEERQKLHNAWQLKKVYLDQLYDLHLFFREAKLIEDATNAQEAALGNLDLGEAVEEVANQLKKHEEFEKVIYHQDEKLDILNQSGHKLLSQNHFDSPSISAKLGEIQDKRRRVHQLCLERKILLDNALLYAEFNRDITEIRMWITEKQKKMESQIKTGDVHSLEDKIKMLQKHQALQAEVAANVVRIVEIKHKGEKLLNLKHSSSNDIKMKLKDFQESWNDLLREVQFRGKGLEEAQDILEFNNHLDKIETWIRDKEVMVQAGDTGRDYEHCQALQRKLDDVNSDMRVDDSKVELIYSLANKLEKQGHKGVQERKNHFIKKWQGLQGALMDYRNKLAGAAEIHLFNRDVMDTVDRIDEKCKALQTEEVGRDLASVQALQRKQEALETELKAVEKKIEEHATNAILLSDKYYDAIDGIQERMDTLHKHWTELLEANSRRKETLHKSYSSQKFLSEVKDLEVWANDIIHRMEARQKPENIAEAETQIEFHNELKAEINGRNEVFNKLIDLGEKSKEPEIRGETEKLKETQQMVFKAWNQHKREITYDYDLQDFKDQINQIKNWLASKEAFLNNDDVGDTPSAVEALIRKHQDFTKMLEQQLVRVDDLEAVSKKLTDQEGDQKNYEVSRRMNAILERKNKLLKSTEARRIKLEESRALQKFLKNVCSVEIWLNQKLQIAADESYREPHNLQSKIQKHSTFEAEVMASDERVQSVIDEGQELIHAEHYAKEEIALRLEEIEEDWKRLLDLTQIKREKLHEAYQALLFIRSIEEFEVWLSEVEAQIRSNDIGNDLASVNNILKRHLALENDYQQHLENCESINEMAEQFSKSNNFMREEIEERAQHAITRFHQLRSPLQAKKDLAESCLMLQQFTSEIDEELQWLSDREPLAASLDLGNSLTAVQSLQKKHQSLEVELNSREHIVKSLVDRAANMTRSGHEFSEVINEKVEELKSKFASVRDNASVRRLRLQDALEAQLFYEESSEAEAWIHDRLPALATSEVGRDEITTQMLQRKLDIIAAEVKAYQENIDKLSQRCSDLMEREHYDVENIKNREEQITHEFQKLRQLVAQREVSLSEALQYFGFLQECTELQEWIKDQMTKSDSEEYGVDVEHVELLIQAFDTFHASILNSEARLQSCLVSGNALIEAKCSYSAKIQEKMSEVQAQWEDLLELVNVRKEALAGAKQVHMFDRTAEEIISWIHEKEADLSYNTYGQDLESIQDLLRKHQAFESEMRVIKDKVDFIEHEAKKLIEEFPDTKEHIDDKREDTVKAYEYLLVCAERRKDNLQQAEQSQVYIDQYQDLLAWINEMLARVTAPELPQEVLEAELLVEKHSELKVEIDAKDKEMTKFHQTGEEYIKENHFMAQDIADKIDILKHRFSILLQTWEKRKIIYDQNLDAQLFKREAAVLENWLIMREDALKDEKLGESILQVEDLIRKHCDFEETIKAQEEKFAALKRKTMIEEAFAQQLRLEELARKAEKERLEQEKLDMRKRQEMQRIAESRRIDEGRPTPVINVNGVQQNDVPSAIEENKTTGTSLRKTNSVAHLFDRDRLRKIDSSIKRAESMKTATNKPIKRTPSFATRRRGSFRARTGNDAALPPVEAESFLDRKQILSPNGKKATNRTWKNSYTVLCGQLMCFFKNKEDFAASKACCPPINIHNAKCSVADDYQKRKNTFRLQVNDGSELLFSTNSEGDMLDWINKIVFRARLPPSQQLLNFDIVKDSNEYEMSSQSSRTSSPEVTESIVELRNPNIQNGSSSSNSSNRHSFDEYNTPSRQEWNNSANNRPNTLSGEPPKVSHRIWDLLLKKKRHTSQM